MSNIDDMFLNYKEYQESDNDYLLGNDGYKLEQNAKRTFFQDVGYYGKDIGIGTVRGGAKLGEGIISLLAAGAEKFVLGPESMKMLDPEGDGIVTDIGKYFAENVYPNIGETETLAGGFAEGITQFLTPGVGYYKLFNGIIKAKGVWPFISRALAAESATVATAQVPGDPNFVGFISQMLNVDTTKADSIAKEVFNYLATPANVEGGYDADQVFEEKFKAILADAPLGPIGEGLVPLFQMTIKGMKKLFKGNDKAIQEINNKMNFSGGAAMNPEGPLAKQIEEGTFKYEFEVPDNPYKGKNDKPISLATPIDELIKGAQKASSAKNWYVKHKTVLKELMGDDADFFEELIGVTSQQASVDQNIERAMMAYEYFKTYGTFANLKALDKNTINPTEHNLPLLEGVIGNLRRLEGVEGSKTGKLATEKGIRERMGNPPTKTSFNIETYLAGNKVPDFVEAMFEGTDEVVVMDRHMIQILFGKKAQVNARTMAEGKIIVTEIANELGWTPKETQAAIWSFNQMRDSDIVKRKTKDINDVRDYEKALTERADAIEQLVTKFSNIEGQSEGIQIGSKTRPGTVEEGFTKTDINQVSGPLYSFISNNPDGFTISVDGKSTPVTGYVLAPLKQTEIVKDAKELDYQDVVNLVENIAALRQSYGNEVRVYAGGWLNKDDGKYYLDASIVVDSKEDALYKASAGNQLAIVDLGAINKGDWDNVEIKTEQGIEELKKSGVYRSDKADVERASNEQLASKFEKTRMEDKGGTE